MKKIILNILTVINLVLIFISGILFIILKTSLNINIFSYFYTKEDLAPKLELEYKQLMYFTENLLLYLKTNIPLDTNWYSKKDVLHMIDVRNLYISSYNFLIVATIIIVMSIIILSFVYKSLFLKTIINVFNKVFLFFTIFIVIVGLFIFVNFNKFWILFHEILFTNDLWLLSEDESNLIKMFPENFFFRLVSLIVFLIIIYFLILFIIKNIIKKYLIKKL